MTFHLSTITSDRRNLSIRLMDLPSPLYHENFLPLHGMSTKSLFSTNSAKSLIPLLLSFNVLPFLSPWCLTTLKSPPIIHSSSEKISFNSNNLLHNSFFFDKIHDE